MAEWGVNLGEWGVDADAPRGGLLEAQDTPASRTLYLCQRKARKHGQSLGKTTGWIHRASLKKRGVQMLGGVTYRRIDDAGLHVEQDGDRFVLEVDHVVVCAGQVEVAGLAGDLQGSGLEVHVIGGAALAAELDALDSVDGLHGLFRTKNRIATTPTKATRIILRIVVGARILAVPYCVIFMSLSLCRSSFLYHKETKMSLVDF